MSSHEIVRGQISTLRQNFRKPVHGMQSYCLAKILLATYDPRLLKLGFESRTLQKESEVCQFPIRLSSDPQSSFSDDFGIENSTAEFTANNRTREKQSPK